MKSGLCFLKWYAVRVDAVSLGIKKKMNSRTRRTFLKDLSALAATGLAAAHLPVALADTDPEPHVLFPTHPRDRIAVPSYPFRAYIESPNNRDRDDDLPGMNLLDFPAHVVEKFNIHNIEPLSAHFTSMQPGYLDDFRKTMQKARVRPINIAVGAINSFYDDDSSARDMAVAYAKKWVDVAAYIGSPGIRTHIAGAKNSLPNVARASESLRALADYAAGKNVVVTLENDDLVTEDAFFIVKVIEAVNHPFLHALPDFANSMMGGDADFDYRALEAMFKHAYNICHVKDGETDDDGKLLNIDLKKSFDILKASNYRGYCSMEFDSPGDPYPPTTKLIEQTIKYLS